MGTNYTAVIKQDGDLWLGWIEELPDIRCQEQTRQAVLLTLRITLEEAIRSQRIAL
ncbi:type II toxin-antitoxin system HicB family antitoxin [Desulfovibrio aerotolerans]|uniref:Type II toxin-antitoxin system HicB family antitoxin n=1 Tax=Solidesulfovibrio aerotolerans TaxID=295255 RepID=A0A7C9MFR4_9BACT|nr:type II toxin-antitoxin system HicB family antitoxin [Solidesulfovibrio aerotolerans]MYL83710.1 type II toxin-antitoxin system HicB family antitoxin [Solidesulfovibrio aerotolerans]